MFKPITIKRKGLLGTELVFTGGSYAYNLFKTHGFPVDHTKEIIFENWDDIVIKAWLEFCKENKGTWWLPIIIFINKLKLKKRLLDLNLKL